MVPLQPTQLPAEILVVVDLVGLFGLGGCFTMAMVWQRAKEVLEAPTALLIIITTTTTTVVRKRILALGLVESSLRNHRTVMPLQLIIFQPWGCHFRQVLPSMF
jgi:hypothetical protein